MLSRRAALTLYAGLLGCRASRERAVSLGTVNLDTFTQLPVIVARELGYFPGQKISADIDEITSAPRAMQALLSGSVDVISVPFEQVMLLAAEHRRIRSFLLMETVPLGLFAVSPKRSAHIKQFSDLKGAIIGVTSPGSRLHMQLNYMFTRAGLEPKEVSVIGLGSPGARIAALESGKVDAAILPDPGATLLQRRYPNLTVLADMRTREGTREAFGFDSYPGGVLIASEKWLGEHADQARAMAAALLNAMQWIRDTPAELVAPRIPRQHRIEDAHTYAECVRKFVPSLSTDGAMSSELASRVRDVLATFDQKLRSARIDPETTYTNEYVKRI